MHDIEEVIKGLEYTKAMITFNPSTGEDIEPENLNEADKTTYDACVEAITLLKKQEAVRPIKQIEQTEWTVCGNCHNHIISKWIFCAYCGKAVRWK